MRTLLLFAILIGIFTFLKSVLKKQRTFNIQLLISMMLFGGIGYAVGDYYLDSGWAIFGAVFGVLVGVELKEKLYQVIGMIYRDFTEGR
ncbi:MAG: hypothetical protein U9O24_01630 [Campylobacterota bacterium]|nr:hypothetical protein [Campylobacterota bacterium]